MASDVHIDMGWVHSALEDRLSEVAALLTARGVAYVPPFRAEPIDDDKSKKGRLFGISLDHEEDDRISSSESHAISFTYEIGLRLAGIESGVKIPFGAVASAAGVVASGFRSWSKRDDASDHTLCCKACKMQVDLRGPQDAAEELQQAMITVRGEVIRCHGNSQTQY